MSTQLINYITSNDIVDKYQSAYLPHRSTETALTLIINDILISLDNKATCYLILIYLSSAFDTLDHNILSIIYILPITSIVHKYPNIHYHLYADDLQIYTSFPSPSDSDLIQMSMFNCINLIVVLYVYCIN